MTVPVERRWINKYTNKSRKMCILLKCHLLPHPFVMKNGNKLFFDLQMIVPQKHTITNDKIILDTKKLWINCICQGAWLERALTIIGNFK
jgi:hypothetical protein